jgi:glycosyltransferase involved in cell wall biosynthesis
MRDIDEIIPGFDIIALTSKNEGTPVSLIEAQAVGVAIVTTLVGGVSDVVQAGKSALVCRSRNPEDFGRQMKQLIEQDEIRKNLSKQGTDFVFGLYNYMRLIEDMKKLYRQLLPEGGK